MAAGELVADAGGLARLIAAAGLRVDLRPAGGRAVKVRRRRLLVRSMAIAGRILSGRAVGDDLRQRRKGQRGEGGREDQRAFHGHYSVSITVVVVPSGWAITVVSDGTFNATSSLGIFIATSPRMLRNMAR